LPQAQS